MTSDDLRKAIEIAGAPHQARMKRLGLRSSIRIQNGDGWIAVRCELDQGPAKQKSLQVYTFEKIESTGLTATEFVQQEHDRMFASLMVP